MSETRKLAAILVADVVGYSRLAGSDEERTLARLRGLRSDLFDPAIAAHHGRIVKRTGDGSIIEFRSVVDAVRCAIEVQTGLIERNAGVPEDRRIQFRVGIHVGDVVEESDGDLMGDGVNIAARLEGIAKPGAICLSEDAYRHVKGRLDLAVSDLGPTQLKNIAEPVRAYSVEVGIPTKAQPTLRAVQKRRSIVALLVIGIVALIAIAAGAWHFFDTSLTGTKAGRTSVVVLPFANLSGDPSQDYVAEALTNDLTDAVSRISGFFVIANNTAKTYKGKPIDAKQIGKALDVHFVLEGSVQPTANNIRVNAQLIDTDSGEQVWAERFDQERSDLVQMEDEIVARLGKELDVRLADVEAARAARLRPDNPEAQDLANRCYANISDNPDASADPQKRAMLFEPCHQALRLDARNLLALKLRAVELLDGITRGGSVDKEGDLKRAREAVESALAIDINDPGAHTVDTYLLSVEGRPEQAIAEAERSLALNPSYAIAYIYLCSALVNNAQPEKAIACLDKEMRLSPRDPFMYLFLYQKAGDLQVLGREAEALDWTKRSLALSPNYPQARLLQISVLGILGRDGEAREAFRSYGDLHTGKLLKTVAEYKAYYARFWPENRPMLSAALERRLDGLRKAGMPEQ